MANPEIKIAPSILAGNFGRLEEEARKAESAGANILHVDVMDGHFVPNITIGPQTVRALRRSTRLPLDVHLMIAEPQKYITEFAKAGANHLTIHVEVTHDIPSLIQQIKTERISCGIAIKPGTPIEKIRPYLENIDLVLLMTVEPGFGGQAFMTEVLPKIRAVRDEIRRRGLSLDIEVDGGINLKTVPQVVQAGANVLVAGSAIYESKDMAQSIKEMREWAEKSQ